MDLERLGDRRHDEPEIVAQDVRAADEDGTGRARASTHGTPFYEGRAVQILINNGSGVFADESAQRIGFKEDTGSWLRYLHMADLSGQCKLDLFPEFNAFNEVRLYTNDGLGHFVRQVSNLPLTFGHPHPIDMSGTGQKSFLSIGGDGFYLVPVTGGQCPVLTVSPATSFVGFAASKGAPTLSFTYVVGTTSANAGFSIIGLPLWLQASPTSGIATTNGTTVTFTFLPEYLKPGTSSTTVSFINAINEKGSAARPVTLIVSAPPVPPSQGP